MDQTKLDEIADTLGVTYRVLDNLSEGKKTYKAQIILTNHCDHPINHDDWAIYLCHIRMIEPSHLPHSSNFTVKDAAVQFTHINGCLFKLAPVHGFKTLKKGDQLEINFNAQYYSVARSDLMPNWYLLYPTLRPALIKSTVGEDMEFVAPFDQPESWKRFDYELPDGSVRFDHYNPYSVQERFDRNKGEQVTRSTVTITPTPQYMNVEEDKRLTIQQGEWSIATEKGLDNEAQFLSEKLNLPINKPHQSLNKHVITLKRMTKPTEGMDKELFVESYTLVVSMDSITICGGGPPGVFYGIQTLLSIMEKEGVPECEIRDTPRYGYRGMHLDVARNFHTKEQVCKLLDVMAMYKMNKFHFHLTDDEGWRLEIPGLEELTTVGSRRGHVNRMDISTLLPLLGSGPGFDTSGTGFYTVNEYRDILRHAKRQHIEVIPEIDMPGHSHAAIKSMKARHRKYMDLKDKKKAKEYLLTDFDQDINGSHSCQMFSENAMNPGLESTYKFAKKVVMEVKKMHEDIWPLRMFHFGGDEVPYEAWEGSPACISLIESGKVKSSEHLMEYFVTHVADVIAKCGLDIGAWQDGVIPDESDLIPISRSKFKNKEVYVYAWQNVWESGMAGCAYRLANSNYKVIMTQGTHLYFDHPYEPDPEERGLYWACRYADSRKVFTFMPDNIYANADFKVTGEALSKDYISRHKKEHEELKKKENVIGIQAQLWTELVRTADQMDSMIFPRLLCVAERAWHKADWEVEADPDQLKVQQARDWDRFAHILGAKELARLDQLGVAYNLAPPGARFSGEDGKLELNCAYPGLPLFYSTDGGTTWTEYTHRLEVDTQSDIQLCTRSADRKRSSRVVVLKKPE